MGGVRMSSSTGPRVPRVSIGMPVYNGQTFLRAAIDSILAQTFEDFELVICDNASTDATEQICRDYAARDARVRYVRNPTNLGAAPNFNRAFELSRAPYFKWMAVDDLIGPAYLARCVAALDAKPAAAMAYPRALVTDLADRPIEFATNGPTSRRSDLAIGITTPDGRAVTRGHLYDPPRRLDHADPVVRLREVLFETDWAFEMFGLMRAGALRRTPLNRGYYGSDQALLAAMALCGPWVEVPEVLFFRRWHPGQSRDIPARERATWMDASRARSHWAWLPTQVEVFVTLAGVVARADVSEVDRVRAYAAVWDRLAFVLRNIYEYRHSHGILHRLVYGPLERIRRPGAAAEPASSRAEQVVATRHRLPTNTTLSRSHAA